MIPDGPGRWPFYNRSHSKTYIKWIDWREYPGEKDLFIIWEEDWSARLPYAPISVKSYTETVSAWGKWLPRLSGLPEHLFPPRGGLPLLLSKETIAELRRNHPRIAFPDRLSWPTAKRMMEEAGVVQRGARGVRSG